MKLQQLVYVVEELKAVVNLYEQTQKVAAQTVVLADYLPEDADDDQRESVVASVMKVQERLAAMERALLQRTGALDVDQAVERVQEHIARLNHFQELRGNQLQLQTHYDLEMAVGDVPMETRQQALTSLADMQTRLETLVSQGLAALVVPKIVLL